jgi:hypothetical protein
MPFGFGGSKSSSSGSSLDFSLGRSGSVGGSTDVATAGSEAGGFSSQSIAFQDIFSRLYGGAASKALGASAAVNPAQQLFSGGLDFLKNLQGNAGIDALQNRVSGPNDVLQGNLDTLQSSLGRLFREELNPAITGDAVAAGALGGGRQGVAQAGAARGIAEQFSAGASSLISTDQAQRDQAAATLSSLLTEGAGLGLQNLPGLFELGLEGELNLAPLSALADILGGPTVLTQAQDFSKSFSESLGESFQEAFSEDFSFGTSQQKSKSGGFNFGLG